MKRGVLYLTWGSGEFDQVLQRSIDSLKRHHPELPYHVHKAPADSNMLIKSSMFDFTPFDSTLYLDADAMLLDRVDYAFAKAEVFGLACCICESPWARRHRGLADAGDIIEYQAGVMFFTRAAKPVFDRYRELARTLDSTTPFIAPDNTIGQQPYDDQAALAKAIDELNFNPFVLPLNYNFRPPFHPMFFGPIKIYHDPIPPPPELEQWNRQQSAAGAVIHHAGLQHGG